jgi:hypothetical protein
MSRIVSADVKDPSKFVWFCDNCGGQGGILQGGMTAIIDHCPQCQHYRCDGCLVEYVGLRQKSNSKAGKALGIPKDFRASINSCSVPFLVPYALSTSNLALLQKSPAKPRRSVYTGANDSSPATTTLIKNIV